MSESQHHSPPSEAHVVHAATDHLAGNGQGTLSRTPPGPILDHPVLDGSTEDYSEDFDD